MSADTTGKSLCVDVPSVQVCEARLLFPGYIDRYSSGPPLAEPLSIDQQSRKEAAAVQRPMEARSANRAQRPRDMCSRPRSEARVSGGLGRTLASRVCELDHMEYGC